MSENFDRNKYLELAASITCEAIKSSNLDAIDPHIAGEYFLTIYDFIASAALTEQSELADYIQRWANKHYPVLR